MIRRLLLVLACSSLALGCGGASVETAAQVKETSAVDLAADARAAVAPPSQPALLPGQIRRVDLVRVLDEGPARLLGRVVTEPLLDKGKFVGFRVKAFNGEPPTVPSLQTGDVVLEVNGLKLERPEQFFTALESLRTAARLEVAVLRNRQRIKLSYEIVD